MIFFRWFFLISLFGLAACSHQEIHIISTEEFAAFVEAADYITEAEQYDWTIVQKNITEYELLYGVDWRCPDGLNSAIDSEPVRQVSYNDAKAYLSWLKHGRLPSYKEYWELTAEDHRPINVSSSLILPIDQVHIVGNVWEITELDQLGRVRLAGGSYLCDVNTCNGVDPQRSLYVDPTTGNSHIGFAIIK